MERNVCFFASAPYPPPSPPWVRKGRMRGALPVYFLEDLLTAGSSTGAQAASLAVPLHFIFWS